MTKQLTILLLAVLLYTACTNTRTQDDKNTGHQELSDTLPYQIDTFLSVSPYFQQVEGKLDSTFVRITYPSFQDEHMQQLVFRTIMEENETLESLGNSFLSGYQNYVEDAQHPEHLHSWFQEINLSLPLYTPRFAVIKNSLSEYTGGAHGNYATLYCNYDLSNNREIPLSELLNPDKTKEFLNIAEKYFREAEGLTAEASLENGYFFDGGIFSMTENYALAHNGLLFHYNIYEVKPYAEGTTDLIIPYDQIQGLLSEYGQEVANYIQTF